MKTNIFMRFLAGVLILSTSGCCHSPADGEGRTDGSSEAAAADHTGSLSFSDFRRLRFTFTSGAGAWATTFTIDEDGSFSGEYRDSDMGYSTLNNEEDTKLPFYALYNENMQYGFMSYDIVENLRDTLSSTESRTARLEDSIENDAALSQDDLNALSADLYAAWDALLNQHWEVLQQILDEDTMELLTLEEPAWTAEKEQAVKDAAASYDGGSVTALVCNLKAADMTRERVYELMEYLE